MWTWFQLPTRWPGEWMVSPWLVMAVAACLLVWFGIALALAWVRWRIARRTAWSRRLGHQGEALARRILRKAGYRLLQEQVTRTVRVSVDGELRDYTVRADALVRRRKKLYVAEYKGGRETATVDHRSTRRQLLEYAYAFECGGVLLVDALGGAVHRVEFPGIG